MREITKSTKQLSITKVVIGIIASIALLIIAQIVSSVIGVIFLQLGVFSAICNVIIAILYVVLTLAGVTIFCKKFLKISMIEMRIPHFKIKAVWGIVAFLMPALVLLFSIIVAGGHWEVNTFDTETTLATITAAIAFFGLATGIVEEVIFRGVIMGCLERRFSIQVAIIIPSVLFGALHIIGNDLDFISTVQLLIAGSIVGILFSLIAYESDSVWNNALVHGVWNMAMIGGILHIGDNADSSSIFNFVLENKIFFLSGGDFGIEASVISIFVYLIFCILAVLLWKHKGGKMENGEVVK